MIFVTVGSQLPFNRLIQAVDKCAHLFPAKEITAQTGKTDFLPVHINIIPFIAPQLFHKYMKDAELIIAHAGMGTIITASQLEKKLILFPRFAHLHEIRNDHQVATCKRMAEKYQLNVAYNEIELEDLLKRFLNNELLPMKFIPDHASDSLLTSLKDFMK